MIIINDHSEVFGQTLSSLCKGSPFGARILAYYEAYKGGSYHFIDHWLCYENETAVCAVCQYYDTVIVCGKAVPEIVMFINMLSPGAVLCGSESDILLDNMQKSSGEIMHCSVKPSCGYECGAVTLTGEMKPLKKVYELILMSYSGAHLGTFEDYFIDISHNIRHGVSRIYAIYKNNSPICALTVIAITDSDAVISGVATHPDLRRRGYAGSLVAYAADKLIHEGKTVWLQREKQISIYEKNGFVPAGYWSEYRR